MEPTAKYARTIYDEEGDEIVFTEDMIALLIDNHERLHELADNRASQYLKARKLRSGTTLEIDFTNGVSRVFEESFDSYSIRYENFWAYGGHETFTHAIPMSMLWAPEETIAHHLELVEQEAERLLSIQRENNERVALEREEHERKEFKRLQKNYGSR